MPQNVDGGNKNGGWKAQDCGNCKYKATQTSKNVLLVFQLACLGTILLNANILGEAVFSIIQNGLSNQLIFIAAVLLNVLEIMNNWASIKIYIEYYTNTWLFLFDILTLGAYYLQACLLQDIQTAEQSAPFGDETIILTIMVSYIVIYALYTLWNRSIRTRYQNDDQLKEKDAKREKDINEFVWIRTGSTAALVAFVVAYALLHFKKVHLTAVYYLFIAICCGFWVKHNVAIRVLETIMKADELGKV